MVGNTLALFGQDLNGISLVANVPGVYFNSYYNGGIRSIQAGQGGNLSFEPAFGRFRFYRNLAAIGPDELVTQNLLLSIESNGDLIANAYRYSSPRTFYHSVTAAAFTSRDGNDIVRKEFGIGGAFMLSGNGISGMVAPVDLPHGATITEVTFYYTDNSATTDIDMFLVKYFPGTVSYSTIASASSSGTAGNTNTTTTTISQPVIDNSNSATMVRVSSTLASWPGTVLIRSVVIAYTMTEGN